jgi:hypothetical protein
MMTRRTWVAATAAGWLAASARADGLPLDPQEKELVDAVQSQAKKVGLKDFRTSRTTHYLGAGNASDAFRDRALKICELLATEFRSHFQFKGFVLQQPKRRMIVVTLADADSFAAFSGTPAAPEVGGFYDRETNRLVMLDNRANGQANVDLAKVANLVSLVHESTHQLTFNTGLLDRDGDVPVCLSEGLATYAEPWQPTRGFRLGGENPGRREVFALARKQDVAWKPIAKLLTDDDLFGENVPVEALQLYYAESWLLVSELMNARKLDGFRKYLRAIRERRGPDQRLGDFHAHLGNPALLDQALRRAAGWAGPVAAAPR